MIDVDFIKSRVSQIHDELSLIESDLAARRRECVSAGESPDEDERELLFTVSRARQDLEFAQLV